jgi:hypothetical protein
MDLSKMLINGKGLADRYSVSGSLMGNWQRRFPDFPEPLDLPMVIGIPIWDVRIVDIWMESHSYLGLKRNNHV